jgi:hypothetical protein
MNPFFAILVAAAVRGGVFPVDSLPPLPLPPLEISVLPEAGVTIHPRRDEVAIELPPVDLPANLSHADMHHHGGSKEMEAVNPGYPPVSKVTMPQSGAIYGFRVEMIDSAGNKLPDQLLHHLNFIDPFHRELFLPISRRMIAAGKETGSQRLPWLLFGLPVRANQMLVLSVAVLRRFPLAARRALPRGRQVVRSAAGPFQQVV